MQLLMGECDVIALGEPTNPLDIEGITSLAQHLKQRWARNSGGCHWSPTTAGFSTKCATNAREVHDGIVGPFEGGYAA